MTNKNNELDNLDFEFKPINKGLGFHSQKEERVQPQKAKVARSAQAGRLTTQLLQTTKVAPKPEVQTIKMIVPELNVANPVERFVAWSIDLACIGALMASVLTLFTRFTGITTQEAMQLLGLEGTLGFLLGTFSSLYLLYFTVLDFRSTPGKYLMGTRVVNAKKGRLRIRQTFMRAFVTLTTGMLLFIPTLIGSDDRVSETSVKRV